MSAYAFNMLFFAPTICVRMARCKSSTNEASTVNRCAMNLRPSALCKNSGLFTVRNKCIFRDAMLLSSSKSNRWMASRMEYNRLTSFFCAVSSRLLTNSSGINCVTICSRSSKLPCQYRSHMPNMADWVCCASLINVPQQFWSGNNESCRSSATSYASSMISIFRCCCCCRVLVLRLPLLLFASLVNMPSKYASTRKAQHRKNNTARDASLALPKTSKTLSSSSSSFSTPSSSVSDWVKLSSSTTFLNNCPNPANNRRARALFNNFDDLTILHIASRRSRIVR
mmetsp:Transcript_19617/g.41114  ORF Transcript_19617/g.41114 Transcript_19617/m.41114 type:complete len:283 (-) Transcript_19617:226-1074(-)